MPLSRVFQAINLSVGATVKLDKQASHHLARVLRVTVGEALTVFNGQGGEYCGHIEHIDRNHVAVVIEEFFPREVESPLRLHLAQGVARGEKMDYIIQKAVELGVSHITPLLTERCTVRLDEERREKRLEHWRSVIISACEQCGRNRLPEIVEPVRLAMWVPNLPIGRRFVLSPHVSANLPVDLSPEHAEVTLLIGPEGGLSDAEMTLAYQAHFVPLSLGPRVLRTETASVAALAVLQRCFGDM